MTRVACVHVAHFVAAACMRAEPTLAERPLAVVLGDSAASRVVDANHVARAAGIVPGITDADARARCAALVTRLVSNERTHAARHALLESAFSVSPRIEDAEPGVVFVDLDGLARLFGDDDAIGERLHRVARRVGLDATVGIAGSRTAALVIARVSSRVTVVPIDGDRAALAPVPLGALALDPHLATTLARWGVRTLGDLATLPRAGLATRLGSAAIRAQDDALGIDRAPFRSWTPPPFWEEAQAVEWDIATWDGLAPLLASVLDRLVARLEVAHLAADGVRVEFTLASGGREDRFVSFAHPLAETKPMLALIEFDIGARPPSGAMTRVLVSARAVLPAPGQRGLWQLPVPSGRDLATTLARLATLVGPEHVGSPVVLDSHRADAFTLTPFAPPPRDALLSSSHAEIDAHASPLAFRRLRPRRPVIVETSADEPVRVTLGAAPEAIIARVGPWRTSGEWWNTERWAFDEWDIALGDGMVCRLVRDRLTERWFLDGAYD
jgi:protein ImuB